MADFSFDVDELVVLQGLQKTPELNGRVGVVREQGEDRLTVELFGDSKRVNVREANMKKAAEAEAAEQRKAAFQNLELAQVERILKDNDVAVDDKAGKDELVALAAAKGLFPSSKGSSQSAKKGRKVDLDEMIDVPGGGRMSRREMREEADRLEKWTPQQMREQLRMLKSRSPQELRQQSPQMRNLTDYDIQMQVQNIQMLVDNPRLKKLRVDALRSGDFSKLNSADATAGMDDDSLRRQAKMQLELFRKDPAAFRQQFLQGRADMTDAQVEMMLQEQSTADAKTLKQMRASMGGMGGGGGGVPDSMTEEQFKSTAEAQVKAFKENPRQARKQMEAMLPEAKSLTDEQLLSQLEMQAKMSLKDVRAMQAAQASGGAPGSMPNLNDMDPQQMASMFKMQRDVFKRDPAQFRKMAPHMANMPDSVIEQQLDMMADMDPAYLKLFTQATGYFQSAKLRLDSVSFGNGQNILIALFGLALMLVFYIVFSGVSRLLVFLFPTTFGFAAAGGASAPVPAPVVSGEVPVQVELEDDAFFAENEDL